MKGYFRKRGNTWSYTVDIGRDPATGKRIQKTKGSFKTKKEAQAACAELINKINKGVNVIEKNQLLKDYLYEWLDLYAKQKVRDTTYKNYKRAIDARIIPQLGNIKINALHPKHGQKFIQHLLDEGLSPRYIEYIFVVLKGAIEQAVKWELLFKNPFIHVEIPRPRKRDHQTWSIEEINRFLKFVEHENEMYYTIFLLAIHTGMRRGEFLGLRWQDVDLETGHICIKQSLVYDEDGFRFTEPKTESSKREILVHEKVIKVLKKHKKTQNEFKLLFGNSYYDQDLIFCREDGKPILPRTLALKFDKVIKKANVPKIRIHDLRHTHATILMQLGENPKIVADRLGHSTIRTTLDTYSHVTTSMQQETARKFGEAILKGNG